MAKANEDADCRRQRRSLTEIELTKLLEVARRRPLLDRMTVRTGKRKGEVCAKLRPEAVAALESLGMERALIYKTLVLTGLRSGCWRASRWVNLSLMGLVRASLSTPPMKKNRQGNSVPLRDDLAADLRAWLAHKLAKSQAISVANSSPIPVRLPANTPLFGVPTGLVR